MDAPTQPKQFLQYNNFKLDHPEDVRRMRAVLANAGYMAFELDIERLWDEFSQAKSIRGKWLELPDNDAELLRILLVGFDVVEQWYPDDEHAAQDGFPSHWPSS